MAGYDLRVRIGCGQHMDGDIVHIFAGAEYLILGVKIRKTLHDGVCVILYGDMCVCIVTVSCLVPPHKTCHLFDLRPWSHSCFRPVAGVVAMQEDKASSGSNRMLQPLLFTPDVKTVVPAVKYEYLAFFHVFS